MIVSLSIEPTKYTATEGCYLLVTTQALLNDAQIYIDHAISHISLKNMAHITKDDATLVTHANCVATST